VVRRGRTVLAMDCVLAGAEMHRGRPLNSVVSPKNDGVASQPEFGSGVIKSASGPRGGIEAALEHLRLNHRGNNQSFSSSTSAAFRAACWGQRG
jgi:hypothetical protein